MRTSQIAMLSAGGALVAGVLVLAVAGRLEIGAVEAGERPALGERVSREMALDGFTHVVVRRAWKVEIDRGDAFEVELVYPEGVEDDLEVEVRGGRLVLDYDGDWRSRGWFGGDGLELTARIVMPELAGVEIEGSGELELGTLTGERLAIDVSGAARVEADGGGYDALELNVGGAGHVDLSNMAFHDADVHLSGATNVELTMTGGVLSGTLSGVGNVRYRGTVAAERINVSGFGRVVAVD